jgi:cobalt-zinc-cadmium efflux system outer membrane protein
MLAAALCLAPLATARPSAQTAAALTIDQAVAEAIAHNPAAAAERYNLAVADTHLVTASLRPNPVVTGSVMLPDATIFNSDVNPKEGIVRGDVLLERGGKRERRMEVAREARGVADSQLQNSVRALILNVQSAFIDVQQAQSDLRLARESLTAFNDVVAINAERVRSGDLASVELARSRLASLQFQNDVRTREAKLAVAVHRLRALLGRTDAAPIEVTGELRRDGAPASADALQPLACARARPGAVQRRRAASAGARQNRLHRQRRVSPADRAGLAHRQRMGPVRQRAASALQPEPG